MKKLILSIIVFGFLFTTNTKAEIRDTLVVSQEGTGDYTTLQDAIEHVRAFMDYSIYIFVKKGVYHEKVVIPAWVENVIIEGEERDSTVITFNDHANINNMGTFRTYTLKIEGNGITLKNITIENNAEQLGQAVALHTEGDRLVFVNCRILGNQDTVYTGGKGKRLYFYNCYIEGTTDYIFGPSTAWFQNCSLHCKRNSYITAASTPAEITYGYLFKNCKITAAEGVNKVYLGRPWRPYAYTCFVACEMGDFIVPEGWNNWRNPENEKSARYSEFECTGAGANTDKRVNWSNQLTKEEADKLTMESFFSFPTAWIPTW